MKTEERGDSDTLRRFRRGYGASIVTKKCLLEISALANTEKGDTPAIADVIIAQKRNLFL